MRSAIAGLAALLLGGCTYRTQSQADCVSSRLPDALQALDEILDLDPPPERIEAGFVLCSTHEKRLLAAAETLGAQGYSSYIGTEELGKCLRVPRTLEASEPAVEREVSAMCRIAAASRIAFVHWQAEAGGKTFPAPGRRQRRR